MTPPPAQRLAAKGLAGGVLAGDRRVLAQALTLVESTRADPCEIEGHPLTFGDGAVDRLARNQDGAGGIGIDLGLQIK